MNITYSEFIDPYTRRPLQADHAGNLCNDEGEPVYKPIHGSYNFVRDGSAEREHYDAHYHSAPARCVELDEIRGPWHDKCEPWYGMLMESMGDISGKRMLLVGAGRSCKEVYFAMCGADVVFTDISLEGILGSSADYNASRAAVDKYLNGRAAKWGSIQFHASDANYLPFPDESFDIVYGAAFVHHLDDWSPFFLEVQRVLKAGGICRFYDQADSRLWSFLKRTLFRPLQMYSYWRQPRSEGDLRANSRGGFNRSNLLHQMSAAGFRELYFRKQWFFLAIGLRHIGKTVNWNKRAMKTFRPIFYCLRFLDGLTAWCHRLSDNRLALIWGFDK